jgi:hypothetical protein
MRHGSTSGLSANSLSVSLLVSEKEAKPHCSFQKARHRDSCIPMKKGLAQHHLRAPKCYALADAVKKLVGGSGRDLAIQHAEVCWMASVPSLCTL